MIARKITAISSASQRRSEGEHDRPSRPKTRSAQCSSSQPGSCITSRGPCDQIRPILVATKPAYSSGSSLTSSQSCSLPIFESALSVSMPWIAAVRPAAPGSAPAAVAAPRAGRTARGAGRPPRRRPFPGPRRMAGRCPRRAPARRRSRSARSGRAQPRCGSSRARRRPHARPAAAAAGARPRRQLGAPALGENDQAHEHARRRGTRVGPAPGAPKSDARASSHPDLPSRPSACPEQRQDRPRSSVAASGSPISMPWYSSSAG